MSESLHENRFAGESAEYRAARDELLKEEIELRRQIQKVADRRAALPPGGKLKEDYVFGDGAGQVKLSELFADGKDSLVIYSFMYSSDMPRACPMCTAILDGLDGNAPHVAQRLNFVVVAKSPYERIKAWADERGWRHLRLLSSEKNTYNADYFCENEAWGQMPAINVFIKRDGEIYHHYSSELLYAPADEGRDARHADMLWPLYNMFDLAPEGRGDFRPKLFYK